MHVIRPHRRPYENNLNHIVNYFMEGDYSHWLNIDADNPPTNNPLELVELDKDIIGCPTPVWHYTGKEKEIPIYWNAYNYSEKDDAYREHLTRNGLQRVDAVGTGCVLISRRVFEAPEMRKTPFTRKLHDDGTVHKGNDMSFCERARECGFEIYCHYGYVCDHYCEINLNDVARAFKGVING